MPNYKLPATLQSQRHHYNKVLTLAQIRDFIHAFVSLDGDEDGWLRLEDFRKGFEKSMSGK